jgi:hypothetical protein
MAMTTKADISKRLAATERLRGKIPELQRALEWRQAIGIVTPPSASVIETLKKADSRVKDAARWLLEFEKKDLSKLTGKQFANLAAELAAVGKEAAGDIVPRTSFDPFAHFLTFDDREQAGIMWAFQDWLKGQFKQAVAGNGWELNPSLAPFRTIDLFNLRAGDESLPGDTYITGGVDCFKIAANQIVERDRDRFGICQNSRCRTPFVANRKGRGKYCSPRCASYVNVMKSRGKL